MIQSWTWTWPRYSLACRLIKIKTVQLVLKTKHYLYIFRLKYVQFCIFHSGRNPRITYMKPYLNPELKSHNYKWWLYDGLCIALKKRSWSRQCCQIAAKVLRHGRFCIVLHKLQNHIYMADFWLAVIIRH